MKKYIDKIMQVFFSPARMPHGFFDFFGSLKNIILSLFLVLGAYGASGQVTIVNYSFAGVAAYPASPTTTAAGISCAATSTQAFSTANGTATGTNAFTANTNTNPGAVRMQNSSGTNTKYWNFAVAGANLPDYRTFKIYFQSLRQNNGATTITVHYSLNGGAFTAFSSNTALITTSYSEIIINLPILVDNPTSLDIRLFASGASGNGELRLDNFQVQGICTPTQPSSITGSATPCLGSSQTYSVTNVAGVTYNWTFPAGWAQTAGGTTNSVTVTTAAGSGNITVTPTNVCGTGPAQTLAVVMTSTDDQNAAGTDSWIGHVYDGTNFNDYAGYFSEAITFNQKISKN